MTNDQYTGAINSIGKTCFVRFYDILSDYKYSELEVQGVLRYQMGYTQGSCRIRTSASKKIIDEGVSDRVFRDVIASRSPKVSQETKLQAKFWLNQISN